MAIRETANIDYKTFESVGEPGVEDKPTVLQKIKNSETLNKMKNFFSKLI